MFIPYKGRNLMLNDQIKSTNPIIFKTKSFFLTACFLYFVSYNEFLLKRNEEKRGKNELIMHFGCF